jgi:hypothetical protein
LGEEFGGGFSLLEHPVPPGTKDSTLDPEALSVRYGIEFDMDSLPRLCAEHGLVHPLVG